MVVGFGDERETHVPQLPEQGHRVKGVAAAVLRRRAPLERREIEDRTLEVGDAEVRVTEQVRDLAEIGPEGLGELSSRPDDVAARRNRKPDRRVLLGPGGRERDEIQ